MKAVNNIYVHSEAIHNQRAPDKIVPLLLEMINPKSVVDVGCGTGTWLKVFEKYGITDYIGIDGSHIDPDKIIVPFDQFLARDISKPLHLKRKFDLALCLEVAEHLPEASADILVQSLTRHADVILFSAAIPGQGGQNHVNEQWPEYWALKFEKYGFYLHDCIRPIVWDEIEVDPWYKQNTFLINRSVSENRSMLSVVHPEIFTSIIRNQQEYLNSLENGQQGLRIAGKIFLQSVLYKLRGFIKR